MAPKPKLCGYITKCPGVELNVAVQGSAILFNLGQAPQLQYAD